MRTFQAIEYTHCIFYQLRCLNPLNNLMDNLRICTLKQNGQNARNRKVSSGIVGVDVDIAHEIAAAMGKELEIKDVAFDSLINELNSGKADFAAAGMSITEERKKEVDFSIEYVSSKQVVVVRKDYNKIKSVNDLNGKTISVQLGSVADTYVTKNFKNSKIVRQKKFLSAAEDVKAKKSECIIMEVLPAKELVKNNSELTILKIELFTDKYAIAVKKGNTELLNKINEVLEKLIEEGKIEEFVINHSS